MKNYLFIFFGFILLAACNNKADEPIIEEDTSMEANMYTWQATLNDSSGRLEMKKVETGGPDSLEASSVINFINAANPDIQLQFIKTSNDTIYLKIKDATHLTQEMGSTGPTLYFANAVYNLTEIPAMKYVNFDFEEGDHAAPGTYNRESFKNE